MGMKWFDIVALVLVLAGALNWGLVGVFNYNLVLMLFGSAIAVWVYGAVGLAAVFSVLRLTVLK